MELQISDLVSAIKKDGIEAANKEADSIVSDAKAKAAGIVDAARAEAKKLKDDAEREIAVFESNAKLSAEQAKRDAMLAFKTELQGEYEKILSSAVKTALDDKALASLINVAMQGEDVSKYAVELHSVTDYLKAELADKIKSGMEIRIAKGINAGFKLAAKDGSGYFDCTDEEITKMLMPFFRDISL